MKEFLITQASKMLAGFSPNRKKVLTKLITDIELLYSVSKNGSKIQLVQGIPITSGGLFLQISDR